MGDTLPGVNDLPPACRNGTALDYSNRAAHLQMPIETAASKEHLIKRQIISDSLQTLDSLGYIG